MAREVFNPDDFRLLRKPCPRYDTTRSQSGLWSQRKREGSQDNGASLVGGRMTYLGPGCYRTLTGIRHSEQWS